MRAPTCASRRRRTPRSGSTTPSSGFKPIPPDEYVAWYADVAAEHRVGARGRWLLLPEHQGARRRGRAESVREGSGHRAPARSGAGGSWMSSAGARPTTACLAAGETDSRTPGSRCSTSAASSRSSSGPSGSGHESEDCFDYSPNNPKSTSGSGLLGTGPRGAAADGGKNQNAWQRTRNSLSRFGRPVSPASRARRT